MTLEEHIQKVLNAFYENMTCSIPNLKIKYDNRT